MIFCEKKNIQEISYTSLGGAVPNRIKVRGYPEIIETDKKCNKNEPQVILNWLTQRDILVIPKSTNGNHIKENGVLFSLKDGDLKRIGDFNSNYRYIVQAEWDHHSFD